MPQVTLTLSDTSYPLFIDNGILSQAGELIKSQGISTSTPLAILSDSNVAPLYAESLCASLHSAGYERIRLLTVPAGEASKSLSTVESVCTTLAEQGIDRHSLLIALGGGVIGDLTGFIAAIHYRGIPFIQIPTTILAQVDSSIGGKTGVNLPAGKNLVGAFHHPRLVLIDPLTLESLPSRTLIEGLAEVVKHAAIRDADMLALLDTYTDAFRTLSFDTLRPILPDLIARNVAIKARVVEADEKERLDIRALLNFGHTVGHGIEAAVPYGELLHGECVSLGMRAALWLSTHRGSLPAEEGDKLLLLMAKLGLPLELSTDIDPALILQRTMSDKKFAAGHIRCVLLKSLGEAYVADTITVADLEAAIDTLYTPCLL